MESLWSPNGVSFHPIKGYKTVLLGFLAATKRPAVAGVAAQRRWPELGMLRLDDAPLFAAGARDTVRVTAWRGCYLRSSS